MKTFANVESYNNVVNTMKQTREGRTLYKQTFCSLSRTLRNMQTKEGMRSCAPIFEALGLPTTGKIKPSEILARIAAWTEDKNGNKIPAYTSRTAVLDKDGNPVLDKDGNRTYTYRLVGVKDGAWTIDKFVKVLANK